MTAILITGMSGTGKSTIMRRLRARGYTAIETDEPGWCVPENGDWSQPDSDWILDEDRVSQLLDQHQHTHLFVDATRPNQGRFYSQFDHVVVFTAPLDVVLHRVANRTENPFGRLQEQREKISQDKQEFEPLLMRGADFVIDTSELTPDDIEARLIDLL